MNNIFLNQSDPLLSSRQQIPQFNDCIPPQYYQLQDYKQQQYKDWVGELDGLAKSLTGDEISELNTNSEYIDLSNTFQQTIQSELMDMVKVKLNNRQEIVDNVKRQISIIKGTKDRNNEQQRRNMNELNDYMKNYSHLTFDEYKKLKENGTDSTATETKAKKKNK